MFSRFINTRTLIKRNVNVIIKKKLTTNVANFANVTDYNPSVWIEECGTLGVLTLNRPEKLNTLRKEMYIVMEKKLKEWNDMNSKVEAILIKGSGRAFCAGADMVHTLERIKKGYVDDALKLFSYNCRINHLISKMTKTVILFLDGITMGAGASLSMSSRDNVTTEKTMWSMPEVHIGYFPDGGSSFFFNNFPVGRHCGIMYALMGSKIHNIQLIPLGIGNYYIESKDLNDVEHALENLHSEKTSRIIMKGAEIINKIVDWNENQMPFFKYVSSVYQEATEDAKSPEEIIYRLKRIASGGIIQKDYYSKEFKGFDWLYCEAVIKECALSALKHLLDASPLSLKITFELLKRTEKIETLEECLKLEYIVMKNFIMLPNDLKEGLRSKLIDKDNKPFWMYESLEKVDEKLVCDFFKSSDNNYLNLNDTLNI